MSDSAASQLHFCRFRNFAYFSFRISDFCAAVEDLSIDFLVVFENAKPKFYYSDVDDLLVDVTVLLHFEDGSRLSDHDIARLLAGELSRCVIQFPVLILFTT